MTGRSHFSHPPSPANDSLPVIDGRQCDQDFADDTPTKLHGCEASANRLLKKISDRLLTTGLAVTTVAKDCKFLLSGMKVSYDA